MGNKKVVLCDTNILIEFYKNTSNIILELKQIGQPNIAISVVSVGELIYGALNKRELNQISKDIEHLRVLHIDEAIGKRCINLMKSYALSHTLNLPDALIAATALEYNIPLYTLNVKDFRFIPDLILYK